MSSWCCRPSLKFEVVFVRCDNKSNGESPSTACYINGKFKNWDCDSDLPDSILGALYEVLAGTGRARTVRIQKINDGYWRNSLAELEKECGPFTEEPQ